MCELCNLKEKTKWYYEDGGFIICDCETCGIPMIVSKKHVKEISQTAIIYIYGVVAGVFKVKFFFRKKQRKIKDHWHWHIILK